jgi:hypothetical protein
LGKVRDFLVENLGAVKHKFGGVTAELFLPGSQSKYELRDLTELLNDLFFEQGNVGLLVARRAHSILGQNQSNASKALVTKNGGNAAVGKRLTEFCKGPLRQIFRSHSNVIFGSDVPPSKNGDDLFVRAVGTVVVPCAEVPTDADG